MILFSETFLFSDVKNYLHPVHWSDNKGNIYLVLLLFCVSPDKRCQSQFHTEFCGTSGTIYLDTNSFTRMLQSQLYRVSKILQVISSNQIMLSSCCQFKAYIFYIKCEFKFWVSEPIKLSIKALALHCTQFDKCRIFITLMGWVTLMACLKMMINLFTPINDHYSDGTRPRLTRFRSAHCHWWHWCVWTCAAGQWRQVADDKL